jgi:hypothetical protein
LHGQVQSFYELHPADFANAHPAAVGWKLAEMVVSTAILPVQS